MSSEHHHAAAVAIRNAIIANPLDKRSPSDFASAYHVSRKNLLPAFKALTGKTIKRFQVEALMQAASNLLLSGKTVKEVAIECGYMHYHHNFSRVFANVVGKGPQEWLHEQLLDKKTISDSNLSVKFGD